MRLATLVSEAGVAMLRELAGERLADIDVLVLDATRPGKFSQHMVLRSSSTSGHLLLYGRRAGSILSICGQ